MATIFGNDQNIRGCFTVFHINASSGRGAILRMPQYSLPTSSYTDPLLVVGFSYSQKEATHMVKTFGDRTYTYAFGHDPRSSVLQVNFVGFMIRGKQYSSVVDSFNKAYKASRVSEGKAYAQLGFGAATSPLRGFVIGMSSNTLDPETSVQGFAVDLALIEVQ